MARSVLLVGSILALLTSLAAQVPPHAVLLNPTASEFEPLIVQSGDAIHSCGIQPDGLVGGFVHYSRSLDGGRTWPMREVPLAYARQVTDLAVDGDLVVVLVHSDFFGPHTITSTDGGWTWALPVRVSQQSGLNIFVSHHLHVSGTTVNVVWAEARSGVGQVWSNRSTDGGVTWQPTDTRLDAGAVPHPTAPNVVGLTVVADSVTLHALWEFVRPSGSSQVEHQRSIDGGVTWLPQPQVVSPGGLREAGGDGNLLVVHGPGGNWRSLDGGVNWFGFAGGLSGWHSVAVDGLNVLIVGGAGGFPNQALVVSASVDGGVTWLPTPYVIVTGRFFVAEADVEGDAFFVHVEFLDQQAPLGSVIQSDDGGVNWRLATNEAAYAVWPGPDRVLVTTHAISNATTTHAYVLAGHTALGQGTPGINGLVPRLDGRGIPSLGRTFSLEIGSARPGSPGAVFASFAPAAPTPIGSATVYVQPPVLPFVFTTSVAGEASVSLTLPASAAFAGLTLTSQALVIDSVAIDGFTATRAIETWIN